MPQLKRIWIFFKIYASVQANSFLYYLYRIPVMGMILPKDMYRFRKSKMTFFLGGAMKSFILGAAGVNLTNWVLLAWLPSLLFGDVTAEGMVYVCLLVCGLLPAILQCKIFTAREEDHLFLNHFMVEPGCYYHFKIGKDAVKSAVCLLPLFWYLLREPELIAVAAIGRVMFCLLGCRVYLYLYDRKQKMIKRIRRYLAGAGFVGIVYILWYLGVWNRLQLGTEASIVLCFGMAAVGIVFYRQLIGYQEYKRIAIRFANKDVVTLHVAAVSPAEEGEQAFSVDSSFDGEQHFEANKQLDAAEYMNGAFFTRLKKSFARHKKQVIWVNLLFGAVVGFLTRGGVIYLTENTILRYTPVLITVVVSLMLYGSSFSAMCFYYMDGPLLHHHLFHKNFMEENIGIRHKYLLKNSLWVLLWLGVDFILIMWIGGVKVAWQETVLLLATLECFIVAYEVYHQLIYYIFRPYTEDVTVRSPVMAWLGMAEGLLGIGALFMRGSLTAAFVPMLIICVCLNLMLVFSKKRIYKVFR